MLSPMSPRNLVKLHYWQCRGSGADEPAAHHIFLINCLAAICSVLAPYECCHNKQSSLTEAMQQHLRQLVAAEASSVLQRSGLQGLLSWHRLAIALPYN